MFKKTILHLGMAMGRARFKGWGFNSCPTSFVLFHLWPASHDKENFLVHPVKLYFFVNLSRTITIVFNKTSFVNKNIFEITNKSIPSNQTNF